MTRRLVSLLVATLVLTGGPAALAARPAPAPPSLSLSPATGPSGTTTTVTARGFAARSSGTLSVGGTTWTVSTDGSGTASRAVPVSAPTGAVPVRMSVRDRSAAGTFTVTAGHRLAFGVATAGGPSATAELDQVAAVAGEQPSVVLSWTDMTHDLDRAGLDAVAARGATPLVTLEPWVAGGGTDQPAYRLARLAAGDHDAWLTRFGAGLASYGRPVLLRFAHEMNGTWYPWGESVNGNVAGDYAAAWRHVHDVVTAAGATQVSWVWSPNVPYPGSVPLDGLYPGSPYVDVVALDGYDWGTSQSWSTWQSPEQLFGEGLGALRRLAPGTPVLVAETAAAEQGGSKAEWVRDLVAYLDAQPDVTGFVWFDLQKETDWRIDSSPSSAGSFAQALAARG